ncbi:HAD family hydrolase [Dactylosporangium sp. AC04546]|uniref:HAD family hydrolase n=1 Tax=Dactylosporangium sp. AC04546 TaxID=2862460 RepID=UPI001EDFA47E|nr:HAD family hydrolase [Dactylosporangium sp. AC04546]WVK84616.1 HAD family hydrolase [Dactylosporangium sp. AC04546]
MFTAVCFDYFNTCTSAVRRGDGHRRTAEVLGADPDEWVDLLDRTFDERAHGGLGNGAVSGLRALCARIGLTPTDAQLHTAIELRLAALQEDAPLRAETVPVLRALRAAGIKVAIVSDCWYELPGFLPTSALAGLFDAAVYSAEVGAAKPHPAMYRTACELLGARPAGCLYVGDGGGRELTGAQAFGMTAVQLAAPDLGDHLTFHAEPDWRGGRIETLHSVLEIVGAPMLVA